MQAVSLALALLLIMSATALAEGWEPVGSVGFSAGSVDFPSLHVDFGTPYVAYSDDDHSGKATVMKHNGTSWETVGSSGFSAGAASFTALYVDEDGTPYVAYADGGSSGRATVMRYDGQAWESLGGAGFSAGSVSNTALVVNDGTLYIAFSDAVVGNRATVMRHDGMSWQTVGSAGLSASSAAHISLAVANGTPYVAYQDAGNRFEATVMRFDGTRWEALGSAGLSDGTAFHTSLAIADGIPYLSYVDGGHQAKATLMKFNGVNWESVGSAGFSAGLGSFTSLQVVDGTPYVSFLDGNNGNKATVMTYNGTNWETVGASGFSAGIAFNTSLSVDNGVAYVAYRDEGNGNRVSVMKFTVSDSTAPVTRRPVYSTAATNTAQTIAKGEGLTAVAATDADGDALTYSLTAGSLPDGITLNSDGSFAGIASESAVGSYRVTITVQDGKGGIARTWLNITVNDAPDPAPSANADLSSLTLAGGTLDPVFAAGTTAYTATVANPVSTVTVTPAADHANATVSVNGTAVTSGQASGAIALAEGTNAITVVVTAEDGSTKTYTVQVNRSRASSGGTPVPPNPVIQPPVQPDPQPIVKPIDKPEDPPAAEPTPAPADNTAAEPEDKFEDLIARIQVTVGAGEGAAVAGQVTLVAGLLQGDNVVIQADAQAVGTPGQPGARALQPVEVRMVELPESVVTQLAAAKANLVVETAVGHVTVPATILAGSPDLQPVSAGDASRVSYQLRMESVDAVRVSVADAGGSAGDSALQLTIKSVSDAAREGLRLAGRIISLTAQRVVENSRGDRSAEQIRHFSGAALVQIPFSDFDDPAQLAVYRLNEATGLWERRGGRVDLAGRFVEVELPALGQYAVMELVTFDDIQAHWAKSVVQNLAVRRIVKGVAKGLYVPDAAVTRAEFAALMVRTLGLYSAGGAEEVFTDVRAEDWFAGEVAAAAAAGLIQGHDGAFRPRDPITRQEMTLVLTRAVALRTGKALVSSSPLRFSDADAVAPWAREAVALAAELELIRGLPDGRFAPANKATRGETATVIERLLQMLQ